MQPRHMVHDYLQEIALCFFIPGLTQPPYFTNVVCDFAPNNVKGGPSES